MMMMMTTTLELSLKSINGSHHNMLTMSGDDGFAITETQVGWFEATRLGY